MLSVALLSVEYCFPLLISETYQEKSHTIGSLSIQIDKYETFTVSHSVVCSCFVLYVHLDKTEKGGFGESVSPSSVTPGTANSD